MNAVVKAVVPDSYASKTIIAAGDELRRINGSSVGDILDYEYLAYDDELLLELRNPAGATKLVRLQKPPGADIGLIFESYLMDAQRSCANKCIFCFIDQLPRGMRETLYYKDDDLRLSFLQGTYITLTNLSQRDIERIIDLRISPINVSVHTLDPDLRAYMLGTKKGAYGTVVLKKLASAGIALNCQIVCCPGVNDGVELSETIMGLMEMGESIKSVSVVPVGLTMHREGLATLQAFDRSLARRTLRLVDRFGEICFEKRGARVFFCADELYILAGEALPPNSYYEEYPQLENGVGMMRLFMKEFQDALIKEIYSAYRNFDIHVINQKSNCKTRRSAAAEDDISFTIATGVAASGYLTNLLKSAARIHGRIGGVVRTIKNEFFGSSVTVSGLLTGRDLIAQLEGHNLGNRLLLPQNMLRSGEDVFLDDITLADVSAALGLPIRVVKQDGADLYRAIFSDE